HLDQHFPGRMLLAEANMWPEDAQQYFGLTGPDPEGDECHMAFHFPLMPRMYMAIAREDRFPITDIMRQTPEVPPNCQWAIFLRNHDELTLEMVTSSERDYLWEVYATDRRARINLGIRRRLAPLMERDRRRIELMNSLLFSMPGTPVIYYGDEIGMGDNIHLGDRDGVRTPMQWSPDRNGGFSRTDPAKLYLPPIMDPIYGFGALNVEAQARSPSSLLNWTRRMVAVRQEHQAFGRGTISFLYPGNRKILAYLREYGDEALLCVFNLSRAAQAVELDLSRFKGRVPIELFGRNPFPPIGELYYLLTLPAYGFHWFLLAAEEAVPAWHEQTPEIEPDFVTLVARTGLKDILKAPTRRILEHEVIPPFLAKQRWFANKDQRIDSANLCAAAILGEDLLVAEVETRFADGEAQCYFLPMAWAHEEGDAAWPLLPYALARVRRGPRLGMLVDASAIDSFTRRLIESMRANRELLGDDGRLVFTSTHHLAAVEVDAGTDIRRLGVEQSNTSIRVGDALILKLYRKLTAGAQPEVEVCRFLTGAGFANTPPLLGTLERVGPDGVATVLAIAQGFVRNQGDGWTQTVEHLERRLEEAALAAQSDTTQVTVHDFHIDLLGTLGRRTAELHRAFAARTDAAAFVPEAIGTDDLRAWRAAARHQVDHAFDALERALSDLDETVRVEAANLLARRGECLQLVARLGEDGLDATKTRIHGDYHLGQVLLAKDDWMIVDFEGEPEKPMQQRLGKFSPLRDVAGMLRSFDYAAAAAQMRLPPAFATTATNLGLFAAQWRTEAADAFLGAYRASIAGVDSYPADALAAQHWLDLFILEKACYEIVYEANNRPGWLLIPVRGVRDLMDLHANGTGGTNARDRDES
ncbi:MAG TPA: putative maltokinase, partial [Rhodanobacteraceae bacterium]|nr:putative maltokinase [Rhodanobacteraceae bacterium]